MSRLPPPSQARARNAAVAENCCCIHTWLSLSLAAAAAAATAAAALLLEQAAAGIALLATSNCNQPWLGILVRETVQLGCFFTLYSMI